MNENRDINGIVKEIDQHIEEIWKKPPAEIRNLLEAKGQFRRSFNLVIYAYGDANGLAGTLWTFRQNALAGVSIASLVAITGSILESYAKSFEAYGLSATADLMKRSSFIQAKIKDPKEYILIAERLIIYLNRLGMAGWLDLLIPWKKMGEVFEEAFRSETLLGKEIVR